MKLSYKQINILYIILNYNNELNNKNYNLIK